MLDFHRLLLLHTMGWPIWGLAGGLFTSFLVRVRGNRTASVMVPWVFLALWLASVAAHYLWAHWHQVLFISERIWLKGLLALVLVALLPLVSAMATEAALARRGASRSRRFALALLASWGAAFLLGPTVAHVAQDGFSGTWLR